METEFEAKFYPVNKEEYRKKLQKNGATLQISERKIRRAIFSSDNYPQFKCDYIRVRDEGMGTVRMSAKIHAKQEGKVSDQKELDIKVDSYEKTIEMMSVMGFKIFRTEESYRENWMFDNADITIDTWPGLESYSEIEAKSENEVRRIAELLNFKWESKLLVPISGVYSRVYHLAENDVIEKLNRNITFKNNPFLNNVK